VKKAIFLRVNPGRTARQSPTGIGNIPADVGKNSPWFPIRQLQLGVLLAAPTVDMNEHGSDLLGRIDSGGGVRRSKNLSLDNNSAYQHTLAAVDHINKSGLSRRLARLNKALHGGKS